MAGTFEVLCSSDDQFYFNLIAANGEIVLTSERYTTEASAQNGIESVMLNAPLDDRYDKRTSNAGEPFFVLKAANGEVIGVSEMYSSTSARDNGIASVKANAPGAAVEDKTSPPRLGTYDLRRSSDGQYYFNLKAVNGRVILTSETYTARPGAENGIESVRTNSPDDGRYSRRISEAGDPFFVLRAGNNQVIGNSEMYSSIAARDNGIESVKNHGPDAEVADFT